MQIYKDYKAAGILPMSIDSNDNVVVLLGIEFRDKKLYLIDIGGKIEKIDEKNSWNTANREFNEETGYPRFHENSLIDSIYIKKCKYVIHINYSPFIPMIPSVQPGHDTISMLVWIPLNELLATKGNEPIYRSVPIHRRLKDIINVL